MDILLILAAAMACGLLFTRIMKLVGLPNVTGYLIAGVLIGPYVLNLIGKDALETLDLITTVALGFIAFSIGSSFKLEHLKALGRSIVSITFIQALGAVILVDIALVAIGTELPVALTLGAIATATAPAATLMVVRQYQAKGVVTNTLLPVVAFDDAIGLMVFAISFSVAKVLANGSELSFNAVFVEPTLEILLSLLVGGGFGALSSFVSRFFKSRSNRLTIILATVFAGLSVSKLLGLSDLLVCMMIGALYANLFPSSIPTLDVLDRWTYPLYMLFFVISGAELDILVIPTVGLIGVVYLFARSLGKYFGARLGATLVRADKNVQKYLGLTLLPQAGVAIGMAQMVLSEMPTLGSQISTVVLCATLVYELIGPIATKIALTKAGEIDPSQNKSRFSFKKKKEQETK